MAAIPQSWEAFARFQHNLSRTTSVYVGAALDAALNVVHQPSFRPEMFGMQELSRTAASAARRDRHQSRLRRTYRDEFLDVDTLDDDGDASHGAASLDDAVHARRELLRLQASVPESDWDLLICIGSGDSYADLEGEFKASSAALRSKVCRLRKGMQKI